MKDRFVKWLKSPVFVIILVIVTSQNYWYSYVKRHKTRQFVSDVDQYYSYLPAAFIHGDLTFNYPQHYWLVPTETGNEVPKVTYGMSLMYLPSFIVGHTVALIQDRYPEDGYCKPYTRSNRFGSLFYLILATYFLFKSLLYFGSRLAAYLSTITIFFATNYFFYSMGLSEMSHSYLFFLFSVIIYQTIKWHDDKDVKRIYYLALLAGLCTLIRPTDGIMILFPILYGIKDKATFIEKKNLIIKYKNAFFIAAFLFFIPIIPQLIYWKIQTGHFLFFSYGNDEGFFFNNPKILEVLFSFRNGLFSYSPVLIFGIIGFFLFKGQQKKTTIAIVSILIINVYIISCWWAWWFGGALGMRAMIQYYPLFAIGLVAFFDYLLNKKVLKFMIPLIIVGFGYINIIQTMQYYRAIIHWDGMNSQVYFKVFGKLRLTKEEVIWFNENITKIDYKEAEKGNDQHVW